ncbi:4Fe-4S dicluster domain-containing protein [uncultured Sunxiuqinia sp.]|uniref:4Fe-4S dicluster domain-containing protein n=1 Tax=uncultured Sunxiuqinia sp. TaxID=1573825 RepID=UPI00262C54D0|nr:4Fe-4S dicluster domain-containing protein [uncultured Sunxiuqinia sp.]
MKEQYYKSLDDLIYDARQAAEEVDSGDRKSILQMKKESRSEATSRRDFLKLFGFTIASAAIATSCQQPVQKAIPFLIQPEKIIPGEASYFASTYFDGNDYCSVLVKVRDGRPIKIEGNALSPVTRGGTNARTQASVLGLYDNKRHKNPKFKGKKISWEDGDQQILEALAEIKAKEGKLVLLTGTIISPSTNAVIQEFLAAHPGAEHIQYDVISASGMLQANEQSYGKAFIPSYDFSKADLIVSFDADFLGSWLSPIEYTKQYSERRKLVDGQRSMSRHLHFEGGMSLTGSNADERIQIRLSQEKLVIANLYNELKKLAGEQPVNLPASPVDITKVAGELIAKKGKSLVVSGSNDLETQLLVNAINELLGNYGNTIRTDVHLKLRQAMDADMAGLVDRMEAGQVDGLILYDVNPVYDYPQGERFKTALQQVPLSIALPILGEETSEHVQYICPDHHYLEAWNDAEVKSGSYSLAQPTIRPIFKTRAAQESLLKWAGNPVDFHTYIQNYWEKNIYPQAQDGQAFIDFWNSKLHDGIFESGRKEDGLSAYNGERVPTILAQVKGLKGNDALELNLYTNVSVGTGKQANNPWLQELPDPVTKICWDNYAAVSPKLAKELELEDEQLVMINDFGPIPVVVQPGQEHRTISVALGYGRVNLGTPEGTVGKNAFPLVASENGSLRYTLKQVNLQKVEGDYQLAKTQSHHSMEGRNLVRETTLEDYLANPASGNEMREELKSHLKSLYAQRKFDGFHWGMAIDLNSCTGCNACVVACSAENNVPVVGKEQVIMAREMHWIRIDRYYKGDPDNPELVRQPVMCQHCDNAPCENVCPVAATTHSNEGVNQMAYNRCIGTRYCNNNCPYKVRRFNFFDYTGADAMPGNTIDPAEMTTDLRRLVLNPDVTVRAKGVIEKCSFCIQRIQEKKLAAKNESRQLQDGEVVPACAQSCPADAIVFGDLNNKESRISKFFDDERNYHLLEELHTLPSVGYLTKVKNKTV